MNQEIGSYFTHARREILPYVPERCERLLDVGCGPGATVAAIRAIRDVECAGGVELDPSASAGARERFDYFFEGDVASAPLEEVVPGGSLDLILCLDILEHLEDPWLTVRRLTPLLSERGRLIVSEPKIRNWKFIWRLLTPGDFHYRDSGMLDRTHLRLFVRETATELVTAGGLKLITCDNATSYGRWEMRRWIASATGGRAHSFLAKQFIVVAGRA